MTADVLTGQVLTDAEYESAACPPPSKPVRVAHALEEYAEYVRQHWHTWTPAQCAAAGARITRLKGKD